MATAVCTTTGGDVGHCDLTGTYPYDAACQSCYNGFIAADADVRVVMITGEGGAFCAGGDVSGADDAHGDLMKAQLNHAREMRDGMHRVVQALQRLDKPVVAMINGRLVEPPPGLERDRATIGRLMVGGSAI